MTRHSTSAAMLPRSALRAHLPPRWHLEAIIPYRQELEGAPQTDTPG